MNDSIQPRDWSHSRPPSQAWVVRAGREGQFIGQFLGKGIVALGRDIGPVTSTTTKAQLVDLLRTRYPSEHERVRKVWADRLARFASAVEVGDMAVTYAPGSTAFVIGEICSACLWKPIVSLERSYVRDVKWIGSVPRSALDVRAQRSLGSISSLFKVPPEVVLELLSHSVSVTRRPLSDLA